MNGLNVINFHKWVIYINNGMIKIKDFLKNKQLKLLMFEAEGWIY